MRPIHFAQLALHAGGVAAARAIFEDLVIDLVRVEHPSVAAVQARPGDWGIDAFVGRLSPGGSVHVWQAKYFLDAIGDAQKRQIREAYAQALKAAGEHGYRVGSWTLCVPCSLDAPTWAWWDGWTRRQCDGVKLRLWPESDLRARLLAPAAEWVYEQYFDVSGVSRHDVLTRLLVGRIADTTDFGVWPSVFAGPSENRQHIERDVDRRLREAFRQALETPGVSVVAIDGEHLSGKTHAAAAALRETAAGCPLLKPATGPELRAVLAADLGASAVVWLDPVEPLLDAGVDGRALAELARSRRDRLLVVAIKAGERHVPPAEHALLDAHAPVTVDLKLRPRELAAAKRLHPVIDDALWEEIERYGLGPAVTASPVVLRAYRRGASPDGQGLVDTMLGWRALGMRQHLAEDALLDLHTCVTGSGRGPFPDEGAFEWARVPRAPGQAMLRRDGTGWGLHPALTEIPPPAGWQERWRRAATWEVLERWAGEDPGRLASIATAAHRLGDPAKAAMLFERAIARGSLRAQFNLAAVQVQHKQTGRALSTLLGLRDELGARSDLSSRPELQMLLASTWHAIGVLYEISDPASAPAAYEEAIALGSAPAMVRLAACGTPAKGPVAARRELLLAASNGSAEAALAYALLVSSAGHTSSLATRTEFDEIVRSMRADEAERLGRLLLRHNLREKARQAFTVASAAGRLQATAQLGALLLDAGSPDAIALLRDAASRGSRAGMLYLGRALRERDPAEAVNLMQNAHDLGSPTAGVELLALLLADVPAGPRDDDRARMLLAELDEDLILEHGRLFGPPQRAALDAMRGNVSGPLFGARRLRDA